MRPIARFLVLVSLLALSLAGLLGAPPAAAQDETCDQLISLPGTETATYTISAPGLYCLATDAIMAASFTSGNAIEIAANYVTLNLNGHKVHGAAAGTTTQAVGIHAVNRRNVTVKNGTVWGFFEGVFLEGSVSSPAGHVVEAVRAVNNRLVGIHVGGANAIIRNNIVANTGPSTAFTNPSAYGIFMSSSGSRALDNDILTVTGAGIGIGIGITTTVGTTLLAVGNRISNAAYGIDAPVAKCRDNLTIGIPLANRFPGCTDAGGND